METTDDGIFFQVGDQVRIKRTGETGRVDAVDGGVVYVLMDRTNAAKIFSASVDGDAYIELFLPAADVQENGAPVESLPVLAQDGKQHGA